MSLSAGVYVCRQEQAYGGDAESAYQHFVRGTCTTLRDHVCKEMNELNLERCRCVGVKNSEGVWSQGCHGASSLLGLPAPGNAQVQSGGLKGAVVVEVVVVDFCTASMDTGNETRLSRDRR
eukprot:scaffold20676_cov19-Tisochrysis_lutea.AAC.1